MLILGSTLGLAAALGMGAPCTPDSAMTVNAAHITTPDIPFADIDSMVVRWYGPVTREGDLYLALSGVDGVAPVFVLVGCDGKVHARQRSGEVYSVVIGHAIEGVDAAALVQYQSGHGTGWMQHSTSVLTFGRDTIFVSFDGETDEVAANRIADGTLQDMAVVTLRAPGSIIRAGTRYRLRCTRSDVCRRTAPKPFREVYVWDSVSHTFLKQAPTPSRARR